MERQPRIVISRTTTYDRLLAQVRQRQGETPVCPCGFGRCFLIVGRGARAKRLIDRLAREAPDEMQVSSLLGEHIAIVNPKDGPLAWGHDSPGKPPVVELASKPRSTPAR